MMETATSNTEIDLQAQTWPAFTPLVVGAVTLPFIAPYADLQTMLITGGSLLAVTALLWLVHKKKKAVISAQGLRYKTLTRTQQIAWTEVTRSFFDLQRQGRARTHFWKFEGSSHTLAFPLFNFSRKKLQAIAQALLTHCPVAEIDPRIRSLAGGKLVLKKTEA